MASHLQLLRAPANPPATHNPASLRSTEALEAVGAHMAQLAAGGRLERMGLIVQEHLGTGGKWMRARLCLAAAASLGVQRAAATPWAASVELLHNATLIHDDIQDGDLIRRGQPTVWVRHGIAQAINAGDLMLMLPFLALERLEASGEVRWNLSRALAAHASHTVRGQAQELDLLTAGHLDRDTYLTAVRGKTGSLFALPVEGAALLAERSPAEAARLGDSFTELGVLFQLQDDVLDLYGDKGRGQRGSDLEEGKVSALVIAHLERAPEDRAWLLELLRTPREATESAAVSDAIARFRQSGALQDVLDQIQAIGRAVDADPILQAEPALAAVAAEVRHLALAPIRHLLA